MVVDGERIVELLSGARRDVLLCAPFIKTSVLTRLLAEIESSVFVRIVTRWRAREVAAGVSDVTVFDVAQSRRNTTLVLLDDLHAKLYLADGEGFCGSANLTGAALGWTARPNVEILVPVTENTPDVALLLRRLNAAVPATLEFKSSIEQKASEIATVQLDNDEEGEFSTRLGKAWLPRCAAPERLFDMYADPTTDLVVSGTREDGLRDLSDLHIPAALDRDEFCAIVRETLRLMPAVRRVLHRIPRGVSDTDGISLVVDQLAMVDGTDAAKQWQIVRSWISTFFAEEFEVAPETFVTRLKRPSS